MMRRRGEYTRARARSNSDVRHMGGAGEDGRVSRIDARAWRERLGRKSVMNGDSCGFMAVCPWGVGSGLRRETWGKAE